jgi:Fe2+ transport system protein FeoA
MTDNTIQLDRVPPKTTAQIKKIEGGRGLIQKLQVMGIRVGQNITLASKQPFRGPVTIKVKGREFTIGRRMAKKIWVEVIQ